MNNENPTENTTQISTDKKDYLKNWRNANNEKIKKINSNYYQKIKDDELFKQKKQEYNKKYYENKKRTKISEYYLT